MIRIREQSRRGFSFAFRLVLVTLMLAPLPGVILGLRTGTLAPFAGLFAVGFGLLGLFLLYRLIRKARLWRAAGRTQVEVSSQPAVVGTPLDYLILLGREGGASLTCVMSRHRRASFTVVNVSLGHCVYDQNFGRWKIRGRLTVPDLPPDLGNYSGWDSEWRIEVYIRFDNGAVLAEAFPLVVQTPRRPFDSG